VLDTPERRDPEQTFRDPEEKALACAITITTQVGSNRSIVMQTYIDRDAPLAEYHDVLDKVNKAVDRQEAKLQIEGLEADLLRMKVNHDKLVRDYQAIEERSQRVWETRGKKGAFKLSEQELVQKEQAMLTIKAGKENLARLEADIVKARGVIADKD